MVVSSPMGKIISLSHHNLIIFIRDKPYSHLKPGQKALERDYYAHATTEKPNGQVSLSNYGRFDSVYNQNVAATVKVGDYQVPNKNANTMSKTSRHVYKFVNSKL